MHGAGFLLGQPEEGATRPPGGPAPRDRRRFHKASPIAVYAFVLENASDMTGSPAARPGFGRLRVKLFLAIAGANAVLAAIAYLVFSASFDRGLAQTLGRADQARLDAFAASLAEGYGRERG